MPLLEKRKRPTRMLIVGAGEAGKLVAREIKRTPSLGYEPVGFADDDPGKWGKSVMTYPVLGPIDKVPEFVEAHAVDEILVSIPSASGREIARIVEICERAAVPYKTIPGLYQLITGKADIAPAREVSVEDLIRREPVEMNVESLLDEIKGRVILVTGGGGSIGSEISKQLVEFQPAQILLLGNEENSIVETLWDLKAFGLGATEAVPVIGDIRDVPKMEWVFREFHPDLVFHTAAYKHVDLMEEFVEEAVKNNILGTWKLMKLAEAYGPTKFVFVSSDKAVSPIGVMGITKRIVELALGEFSKHSRNPFLAVRLGNVFGSKGSVYHLFSHQLASRGPLTITDANAERFLMRLDEAAQLIIQTTVIGENGDLLVLDMGERVKIGEIAEQMIRLAGLRPHEEVEIVTTGLRPGEKLTEELLFPFERAERTENEGILKVVSSRDFAWLDVEADMDRMHEMAEQGDREGLLKFLGQLVG